MSNFHLFKQLISSMILSGYRCGLIMSLEVPFADFTLWAALVTNTCISLFILLSIGQRKVQMLSVGPDVGN